jgi:hypothetical protein
MRIVLTILLFVNLAFSIELKAQNSHDNFASKNFLSSLSVYPNPIEDKINVNFLVKKDNMVSIKLIDVLGNEIAVIVNDKFTAGEYSKSFLVPSKVTKGLYFVKVSVGTEVGIKRISIQ